MPVPEAVYTDLQAVILLYKNGDLPIEQRAFPYYENKQVKWVHQEHLKNLVALESAYLQANTQKAKK